MKKKKLKIQESSVLFVDAKNIKTIDEFLLIVSKNIPVIATIIFALEAIGEKDFLQEKFDITTFFEISELHRILNLTFARLMDLCNDLQKYAVLPEEEIIAEMTKNQVMEAYKIVEASRGNPSI